jgi:hypothetical protein
MKDPKGLAEELKKLKSVSNGGYHYFGAVRIIALIGKSFAEEIVKLQKAQPQR